jgi:hypothetical protein
MSIRNSAASSWLSKFLPSATVGRQQSGSINSTTHAPARLSLDIYLHWAAVVQAQPRDLAALVGPGGPRRAARLFRIPLAIFQQTARIKRRISVSISGGGGAAEWRNFYFVLSAHSTLMKLVLVSCARGSNHLKTGLRPST